MKSTSSKSHNVLFFYFSGWLISSKSKYPSQQRIPFWVMMVAVRSWCFKTMYFSHLHGSLKMSKMHCHKLSGSNYPLRQLRTQKNSLQLCSLEDSKTCILLSTLLFSDTVKLCFFHKGRPLHAIDVLAASKKVSKTEAWMSLWQDGGTWSEASRVLQVPQLEKTGSWDAGPPIYSWCKYKLWNMKSSKLPWLELRKLSVNSGENKRLRKCKIC